MNLEKKVLGEVIALRMDGTRLDAGVAVAFKESVGTEISNGARHVILDLGAVEFMDSSGLGAIVALLKRIGRDGDLVLAGTRPAVRKLLQITRIDRILTQHATVDEAARALGAGPPAA